MKYTILAVDDEPDICWVISQYLTENGFNVLTSSDSHEVVGLIESKKPDLLILDKKMPGMDGVDILRELIVKDIQLPVILMTGSVGAADPVSDMEEYADIDLLVKPVSLKSLKEKIQTKLSNKK